jgi:5'-methylthioadenosine phosphorylase
MQAEIGIIGGTGVYDVKLLKNIKEIKMRTPYGPPSNSIKVGELHGKRLAFLPRHGKKHTIRPTDVNSRANIIALKKLGVNRILATSTVGSLREDFKPGEVVFVDQFIDRTTRREESFYTKKRVCHISVAEPFCPELRQVLIETAQGINVKTHNTGTFVCIEGPRFSTKAESRMHKMWGADVVGMTIVPECVLAREAEICYAVIAVVTDYDVWKDMPVCVEDVVRTMRGNVEKIRKILTEAIPSIPKERRCECKIALKSALV